MCVVVGSSVHVEEQTVLILHSQRSSGNLRNPDLKVLKIQTSLKKRLQFEKLSFLHGIRCLVTKATWAFLHYLGKELPRENARQLPADTT